MPRTLVFDLDDTLIATAPLYETAITAAVDRIAAAYPDAGMDRAAIRDLQEEIDGQAVAAFGFAVDRFPWSLTETARRVASRAHLPCPLALEQELDALGRCVYDDVPRAFPDTHAVLERLGTTYELILYTLGVQAIQKRKIAVNDLRRHFAAVHIVAQKTGEALHTVIGERDPRTVTVIGDSLRGEIAPAIALGCRAVLMRIFPAWRYSEVPVGGVYDTVHSLTELIPLLENTDGPA